MVQSERVVQVQRSQIQIGDIDMIHGLYDKETGTKSRLLQVAIQKQASGDQLRSRSRLLAISCDLEADFWRSVAI
jgi:hypothetical protein